MGDIEDRFSLDPDGFEEIEVEEEIPEVAEDDERITAVELNRKIVQTFNGLKPREFKKFTKCKFNKLAMESIEKRVKEQIHGFMALANIQNPEELSISNPPYEKKIA
jgi:hypothetical protein